MVDIIMKNTLRYITVLLAVFIAGNLHVYSKSDSKPEVRIETEIKGSGYVGEAMEYIVRLISTSPEIANVQAVTAPKFPEGVKVIQGVARDNRPQKTEEKGKTLYNWTIMRYYLVPEGPGKFSVSAGKFVAFIPYIREINQGFWGWQRVMDYEEMELEGKAVSFKAKALPTKKEKMEFSDCVGDFKVEGWFPPGKILEGNEAIAVITISGFGSLENIKLPNLYKIFGDGCTLKQIEQDDHQMQRDGKLYSEVTLTCKFVADKANFKISPLCLLFFNPATGKYYETCSDELHWTETPSKTTKKTDYTKGAIEI